MRKRQSKMMTRQEVTDHLIEAKIIEDAWGVGMDSAGTLYAGGTAIAFCSERFYDRAEVRKGVELALFLKEELLAAQRQRHA